MNWLNYFDLLRVYSLVDLALLLFAAEANARGFFGGIVLHISFLAFLESCHKQEGREPVPTEVGLPALIVAVLIWGQEKFASPFLLFTVMYAAKNRGYWGLASPFARGAQIFLLTVPFASLRFSLIAACAMAIRNVAGDWRDVVADRRAGMHTWPIVLGVKEDWLFLHLAATVATTWLWWCFTELGLVWPLVVALIELASYYWTPRVSNQKALTKLQNYARRLHLAF